MVSALIYKRGHIHKEGGVVPISNNQVVEDTLGSQGIICIEDIVHSLVNSDRSVDKVLSCLWQFVCLSISPFKLTKPKEGTLKKNRQPFLKEGDWGNRYNKINDLLKEMI